MGKYIFIYLFNKLSLTKIIKCKSQEVFFICVVQKQKRRNFIIGWSAVDIKAKCYGMWVVESLFVVLTYILELRRSFRC